MKWNNAGIAPVVDLPQETIGGCNAGQSLLCSADSWISAGIGEISHFRCKISAETDQVSMQPLRFSRRAIRTTGTASCSWRTSGVLSRDNFRIHFLRCKFRNLGAQDEIRDITSGMILVVSGEKQERENSDKPGRREWLRSGISAIILHFISRFALEKNRFSIII